MKSHVKIDVNAGTLANMTVEQFKSLQQVVLAEGNWDTLDGPLRIDGAGDYVGVYLPNLFLGIEKDGYAHS